MAKRETKRKKGVREERERGDWFTVTYKQCILVQSSYYAHVNSKDAQINYTYSTHVI